MSIGLDLDQDRCSVGPDSLSVLIWVQTVCNGYQQTTKFARGCVAQLVTCLATDASLTADLGVGISIPVRSDTFVEIMK